jgi:hypothetical protein
LRQVSLGIDVVSAARAGQAGKDCRSPATALIANTQTVFTIKNDQPNHPRPWHFHRLQKRSADATSISWPLNHGDFMYGIVGLLLFVLDIYVIYLVIIGRGEPVMKLVWVIVVLILPLLGPILYLVLGRGNGAL